MKLFVYKTIFIILCLFLLFEFTVSRKISQIENKIQDLSSEENKKIIKQKIRKELNSSLKKDKILNKEDAILINKFLEKIKSELRNN